MEAIGGKKEIIKQLKEKILSMERSNTGQDSRQLNFGLGPMNSAFPGGTFPIGAIHEFTSSSEACTVTANGFISGLLSTLMKKEGVCLWISVGRKLFPPALKFFNIEPHRVIFIDLKRQKDTLWVMEQGLKCNALVAVVAELRDVSFAESRRLQLAVEGSRVTGFLHRRQPRFENTLACIARWKISPLPSQSNAGFPGVGFPRMEVELEKIRNGRPSIWQFEWRNGAFHPLSVQQPGAVIPQSTSKEKNYA